MFTDKELDILEIEIFPVVNKFNDLQKVFENLNEDQIELFSKWCQSEDIDISKIITGTFGKEENDVLYLCGYHKNDYKKYKGGKRRWSEKIKEVITETRIILPENCIKMFYECEILESIEGSDKGDTSKVKDMDWMFYGCTSLEELDVSNGNTSNVGDMSGMFSGCAKLEFLNVSNGNVSKVESMYEMFAGCASLDNLNVFNGNVSKVKDMFRMFNKCKSLGQLDVSNWDISKVECMSLMFYECTSLIELKGILNGNLSSLEYSESMFDDTPDFKDKNKVLQKFGAK